VKKEPKIAKIIISLIGFICVGTLMFVLGKVSNTTRTSEMADESREFSYVIESGYVPTEINFDEEASYIKKNFHSSMSKSKIKHILIYIDGMCEHYNLNYNLVKSVISTESHWNHKAKSNAGAKGLMQIMKACAKDYKTPHSEMYDPYVNVTIGIKYLAKLTNRFDNTPTALVGYNEGPRYAQNFKVEYINNSRYVHKVMTHLLKFEPYIAGV
jgi:hypothetical protein